MTHDQLQQPTRRRMLGILGGLGVVAIAGCGDDGGSGTAASTAPTTTAGGSSATTTTAAASAATTTAAATATTATSCSQIPEETAGPYPGDGTNGPNVLTVNGVVRSDIRSSVGTSTTVATGVPLTTVLTIVDKSTCKPVAGAAVYLWHCDKSGNYSMYSQGVTNENYLRGVQETDSNGQVTFVSIFPAAYSGRWPHIHFEVFPSLAVATNGKNKKATSQLALPEDVCKLVFATTGYEASVNPREAEAARDQAQEREKERQREERKKDEQKGHGQYDADEPREAAEEERPRGAYDEDPLGEAFRCKGHHDGVRCLRRPLEGTAYCREHIISETRQQMSWNSRTPGSTD